MKRPTSLWVYVRGWHFLSSRIVTHSSIALGTWPLLMQRKLASAGSFVVTRLKQRWGYGGGWHSYHDFFGEKFKSCQFSGSSAWRASHSAADPHRKHLQESGSHWADRRQRFFLITRPLQNGKARVLPAGICIDLSVWCFNKPSV